MIDLHSLGRDVKTWQDRNFCPSKVRVALQLCEEAGEVARAVGKESDGVRSLTRGNVAEELSDVLLIVVALAAQYNIDLEEAVCSRSTHMHSLDFRRYPETGRASKGGNDGKV